MINTYLNCFSISHQPTPLQHTPFINPTNPIPRMTPTCRLIGLVPVPDLPYLRELAVNMVDKILATPLDLLPDASLHTQVRFDGAIRRWK